MSIRKFLICDRCGAQERAATATQSAVAMREYAANHSGWNEIPYVGDFCADCAQQMREEREAWRTGKGSSY